MKTQQFLLFATVICFSEMVIAQGQIGIGTTTPEKQLHITGALMLPETSHADTGIIYLGNEKFIHNYHPYGSVFLNTFIGRNSGNLDMFDLYSTSGRNTGIGANSLQSIKLTSYSTAIGADALKSDTAGLGNTAVGAEAMLEAIDGYYNTGAGFKCMYNNEDGNRNSAFGSWALYKNTGGSFNTALGHMANAGSSYGDSNTCVGYNAGYGSNYTGFNNGVMLGALAGYSLYDGTNNIVIGYRAGYWMSDCDNNVVIGARAVESFSLGHNNIVIGHRAGQTFYAGSNIILIGYNIDYPGNDSAMSIGNLIFGNNINGTGSTVSTGNIGIGVSNPASFRLEVAGGIGPETDNTRNLGSGAKRWRTVYAKIIETDSINGDAVTGVITPAGFSQGPVVFGGTSGTLTQNSQFYWNNSQQRLGIGTGSPDQQLQITGNFQLPNTTSSSAGIIYKQGNRFIHDFKPASSDGYNTFMGINSGNLSMSGTGLNGSRNTGYGYYTLTGLADGYSNTAVGYNSLKTIFNAYENTAVGAGAMEFLNAGNENTAVGISAMSTGDGGSNVAIGARALFGSSGQWRTGNVAIGFQAGYGNTTGSNNIFIGYQTGINNSTGSRNIVIGYNIDPPVFTLNNQLSIGNLIYGTGLDGLGTTISNGNIGIGVSSPDYKLQVNGTLAPEVDQQALGTPGLRWDGNFYDATVDGVLDFSDSPAYPKIYNQSSEPDIPSNTFAFWVNSTTSDYYIILDVGGTQKKALMND